MENSNPGSESETEGFRLMEKRNWNLPLFLVVIGVLLAGDAIVKKDLCT
jgi:hypothetical protein